MKDYEFIDLEAMLEVERFLRKNGYRTIGDYVVEQLDKRGVLSYSVTKDVDLLFQLTLPEEFSERERVWFDYLVDFLSVIKSSILEELEIREKIKKGETEDILDFKDYVKAKHIEKRASHSPLSI